MTLPAPIREQVRRRAEFACEFCGVSETDAGGSLTVDHFQPRVSGGTDDFDNLIYCCACCNQYKHDYWPTHPQEPRLWNPRHEPPKHHLIELEDGRVHPLTATGSFTLLRLRLNRPPLVAWRLRKRAQAEEIRLLERYRDLVQLLAQLHRQKAAMLEEQQQLLAEQRSLLRLLLGQE